MCCDDVSKADQRWIFLQSSGIRGRKRKNMYIERWGLINFYFLLAVVGEHI